MIELDLQNTEFVGFGDYLPEVLTFFLNSTVLYLEKTTPFSLVTRRIIVDGEHTIAVSNASLL